jgi:chromosomal replication initiation ATPase DnaA
MDLSEIPTPDLLMEIQRRCNAGENHVCLAPVWAVEILRLLAEVEGVTLRELVEVSNRSEAASTLRHMAMALLRGLVPHRSLEEIAAIWKQDHSTVIYAVRRIDSKTITDPAFRRRWQAVIDALTERGLCRSARQPVGADSAPAA